MLRSRMALLGLSIILAALTACGGGSSGPATYTVGGTVTGLKGTGLVLHLDPGPDLSVNSAGTFTFSPRLLSGAAYTVSIKAQPSSPIQFCSVANDTGTLLAGDVSNVSVTCAAGYSVGGTVSGLVGSGLVLQLRTSNYPSRGSHDLGSPVPVQTDGAFTFDTIFSATYNGRGTVATIKQQPASPTQRCVLNNAAIMANGTANVTDISVVCAQFSYATNSGDGTVSAYAVNASTGALTAVGPPVAAGKSPYAIAGTSDKKYLFVGNKASNDVSAYAVNATNGNLTPVPGSPFAAGTQPQALTLCWGDRYLCVANAGSDSLSVYAVDPSTGALTPSTPANYATGKGPSATVTGRNGPYYLFVANNGGSNDISVFSFSGAGALTPVSGSPFAAGGNPHSLALGASGKFLYSANFDGAHSTISGFSVDSATGALTPLAGSPFQLAASNYIATDNTGAYLYVTSGASVVGYRIDATTGLLTALGGFPVSVGANAYSVSVDPTNQFLYVANDGAASISGFVLDAATGGLSAIAGSPFAAGMLPDFIATF
jgi:6-phosphogluconolactonase (cycloisomerase 2 family)